jgi:protein-tyrosine phosphatase
MFSALLLSVLQVPRAQVVADYLLTNELQVDRSIEAVAARINAAPEAVQAVAKADPAYLNAMFRTIDEQFGSLDNYRRDALGISDADLIVLKGRLLER